MSDETVREALMSLCRALGRYGSGLVQAVWQSGYCHNAISLAGFASFIYRVCRWVHDNLPAFMSNVILSSKCFTALRDLARYVMSWFRKPREDGDAIRVLPAARARVAESIVVGSDEIEMPHRRGEAFVLNSNGQIVGKGVRIFNAFVTMEHNCSTAAASGNGKVYVRSTAPGSTFQAELDMDRSVQLASDVVGFAISVNDWSKLSIPQVVIGALDSPATVTITGCRGLGTTARLSNCPAVGFGYLKYNGTTTAGYSGASYCVGTNVLGLHQSGGAANLGVAADFIRARVKRMMVDSIPEADDNDSSLDWANKEWFDGDVLRAGVRIDRMNFDEVTVFAKGRYHVFDVDDVRNALGNKKWNALNYQDNESLQVFPIGPSHGASSSNLRPAPRPAPRAVSAGTLELSEQSENSQVAKSRSQQKKEQLERKIRKQIAAESQGGLSA